MKIFKTRNDLINYLPSDLIMCEIGVFEGEFSEKLFKSKPKELHLIDIFAGHFGSGDKDGLNIKTIDLNISYNNLKQFYKEQKNVYIHKGFGNNILKNIPDSYFDFMYIDADHSYEAVKKDLELCKIKTKPGGIIAGHDYNKEKFCGVVDAVNEFCLANNYYIEYMTEDGCPTYGIFNNK
jgi:hypothetical protein